MTTEVCTPLAAYLRQLARAGQHGHSRKPDNFHMTASYCSFYWGNHGTCPDHATWERVARLSSRYHSFVTYCREVAPQWVEVERIYFADNSIEAVQRASDGRERRVMVAPPSGDRCF
jgi:predicted DNA-binding protein